MVCCQQYTAFPSAEATDSMSPTQALRISIHVVYIYSYISQNTLFLTEDMFVYFGLYT